jgi:outer membrane protein
MMRFFTILFLIACAIHAQGQKRYSLKDCYDQAIRGNLALKQSRNETEVTGLDLRNARMNRLPSLSYNMDHYMSTGKNIDPVSNSFVRENFNGGYMGLSSELKIFSGFNNLYTVRFNKYNKSAAEFNTKKTELDVLSNVTVAFAKLLFNKEQSTIVRNNREKTLRELEITKEKIKLGRLGNNEFYILNARLSTEDADIVNVKNDSLSALQNLKQLLNIPYNDQMDIMMVDTSSLLTIYSYHVPEKAFIQSLLEKHPSIGQAKMTEEVARMRRKIAQSSLFPSISIGGNIVSNYNTNEKFTNGSKVKFSDQLNTNMGQNLYVSLQIPLFSQSNLSTRVRKEAISIENAGYARTETENQVITNSLQLLNDFYASKENYKSSLIAWQNNQLSYAIYEEKYRLGQVNSLELITAKDILNNATSKYLNAKFDMIFRHQLLELLRSDMEQYENP